MSFCLTFAGCPVYMIISSWITLLEGSNRNGCPGSREMECRYGATAQGSPDNNSFRHNHPCHSGWPGHPDRQERKDQTEPPGSYQRQRHLNKTDSYPPCRPERLEAGEACYRHSPAFFCPRGLEQHI